MFAALADIPQNTLLAALPAAEWDRVGRKLRRLFVPVGEVLYEPGTAVDHVYFPETSVTSVSCVLTDGRTDALTLIGREGFAGVEVLLGSGLSPRRAEVLSEGWAYRIRRELLNHECRRGGPMRTLLLRYVEYYIMQIAQTIVCNRHHSVDEQLCRWLLMFLDRQASNELPITHEHMAEMMGIRRESVTRAAGKLQIGGCIRNHRGHMSVVDRAGLEARSCECYGAIKRESKRLLGTSYQPVKLPAAQASVNRAGIEDSQRSSAHASAGD